MFGIPGILRRWAPACLVMIAIFTFSSRTSSELPNFGALDYVVKKAGHVLGYGLLALAYWWGLALDRKRLRYAWLLAVAYAASDEFHQLFVAGRHASVIDVLLFDGGGAAVFLWLAQRIRWRGAGCDGYSNSRSNSSSSPQSRR